MQGKKIAKSAKKEIKKEKPKPKERSILYAVLIGIVIGLIAGVLLFSQNLAPVVKPGDNLTVRYIGTLDDGQEFDSGVFNFTVGSIGLIPGFSEGVIGMKKGQTKTFTLAPEKAYGEWDPSLVLSLPLIEDINRTIETTKTIFNMTFSAEPELNKTYKTDDMEWPLRVIKISGENITLTQEPELNHTIMLDYGTSVVTKITDDKITIQLYPLIGRSIPTLLGPKEITDVNQTHMFLDLNHPLAGENLTFTVSVLEINP